MLERVFPILNENETMLELYINWSKAMLMHVWDGPNPPPIIFGNNPWSQVSKTTTILIEVNRKCWLAAGIMASLWRPLCWQHIFCFIKLCLLYHYLLYTTIQHWDLPSQQNPHLLCPAPLRECTGPMLCSMRIFARRAASQAFLAPSLMFTALVTSCNNLMTTPC